MLARLALLALAGAVGALCRFGVYHWFLVDLKERFPWATVTVNCVGCFLFALIATLADEIQWIRPETRTILLAGFIGSFTTFSTFAYEVVILMEYGYTGRAVLSLLLNNVGGCLCVIAGIFAARVLSA